MNKQGSVLPIVLAVLLAALSFQLTDGRGQAKSSRSLSPACILAGPRASRPNLRPRRRADSLPTLRRLPPSRRSCSLLAAHFRRCRQARQAHCHRYRQPLYAALAAGAWLWAFSGRTAPRCGISTLRHGPKRARPKGIRGNCRLRRISARLAAWQARHDYPDAQAFLHRRRWARPIYVSRSPCT